MQNRRGHLRDAWIKAGAAMLCAGFLAWATYAGGGWRGAYVETSQTTSAEEELIEEGIEGPAEGTDAPSREGELFPSSPVDVDFSDNPSETNTESVEGAMESGGTNYSSLQGLDAYLKENFPETGLPGMGVVVVDAGGIDYEKVMGDITSDHDTMLIGSLSKSFTALSIMQLSEAGELDLDAPANQYVDAYGTPDDVTVRMLLNQTSGFGYYDSLDQATSGPLKGTFSYANANYDLLGKIVEAVSGESYADYVEEHILGPLGMEDSSPSMEARASAHAYRNYFGWNVADGFVHEDGDSSWGSASSGYMATSVADFAKYLIMYLNQGSATALGGAQILSASGIRQMFLSRVSDPASDTFYGMGWTSYYWENGELILSHDGDVENGIARMVIFPERGIAIAIFGDAADSHGGNGSFYEIADGIVAKVVGGEAEPVRAEARIEGYVQEDVRLALLALCAILPLVRIRKWRKSLHRLDRATVLARLVILHLLFPLCILAFPFAEGYQWRDVATFTPDTALVLAGSALVLFATGFMKAAFLAHAWHGGKEGQDVQA